MLKQYFFKKMENVKSKTWKSRKSQKSGKYFSEISHVRDLISLEKLPVSIGKVHSQDFYRITIVLHHLHTRKVSLKL